MKQKMQFWFFVLVLAALPSPAQYIARQVYDLNPGTNGSFPSNITAYAGSMLFSAYTLNEGRELWKYNGSAVVLATNINETADDIGFGVLEGNDSIPDWLTEYRGALYFSAFDPRRGGELWRYNGANATRVADINPDLNDTIKFIQNSSWPNQLIVFNDALYFSADSNNIRPDYELWKYDGANVSLVSNIHPNVGEVFGSHPHNLTVFADALYFSADDGSNGYELWKHTGTATTRLDINPGPTGSFPRHLTVFDGHLYFQAYTDLDGVELWRTDGATVSLVTNLNAGAANSQPEFLKVFNGALYFRATDGLNGYELWEYDGTSAILVSNINALADSFPKNLTTFGNRLCFAADDGVNGWELWSFDGERASMVTNLNAQGDSFPENLVVISNTLFFVATTPDTGYEVWSYDGTKVALAADIYPGPGSSYPQLPGVFNGELYFRATDAFNNWELWKLIASDPATPGKLVVSPGDNFIASGVQGGAFTPDAKTYFLANDGGSSLDWVITLTADWLTVSKTQGTLAAGAITSVTISLNENANSLPPGDYTDILGFTNITTGVGDTNRLVALTVSAAPGELVVTPRGEFMSTGPEGGPFSPSLLAYTLTNSGSSSLNWTAAKTQTWITLSASGGILAPGASTIVTVSINNEADGLPAGSYSDTISFVNTTTGNGDTSRPVSLTVNSAGRLEVSPASGLTSTGAAGGPFSPSSLVYTLTNSGGSSLNWTAAKAQSWVTLSATSGILAPGASTALTVSVNSEADSLPAGSYSDTISFLNTTTGNGDSSRPIVLTIDATPVRLIRIQRAGADIQITWIASGGATNFVQAADNLSGPYRDLSGPIVLRGSGEVTTNYVDTTASTSSRFYRVLQP